MAHTMTYNADLQIIELTVQGNVAWAEALEMMYESAQLIQKSNCFRVLSNYSEATVQFSTVEIYRLPQILSDTLASSGISVHQVKRALVVARDLQDFQFFDTVSNNRVQKTRIFRDRTEAKNWLLAQ